MDEEQERTLWCGNLHERVTEEILYELFLQAGPLESVRIATSGGKKQNFAFIKFQHKLSVPFTRELMARIRLFGQPLSLQARNQSAGNSPAQTPNHSPRRPSPNFKMPNSPGLWQRPPPMFQGRFPPPGGASPLMMNMFLPGSPSGILPPSPRPIVTPPPGGLYQRSRSEPDCTNPKNNIPLPPPGRDRGMSRQFSGTPYARGGDDDDRNRRPRNHHDDRGDFHRDRGDYHRDRGDYRRHQDGYETPQYRPRSDIDHQLQELRHQSSDPRDNHNNYSHSSPRSNPRHQHGHYGRRN